MQVLDAVDERQSALVCAPTSSGKTFISSYCMYHTLTSSSEGRLVFVAPTKALVNQVAAQVRHILPHLASWLLQYSWTRHTA